VLGVCRDLLDLRLWRENGGSGCAASMRVNTAARRIDSPGNTELPTSHNPEPRTSDPTARKLLLDREIGPHIEGSIGPLHLARVSAASAWESTFRWSATFLQDPRLVSPVDLLYCY
jgi:hypothetical protein